MLKILFYKHVKQPGVKLILENTRKCVEKLKTHHDVHFVFTHFVPFELGKVSLY